MDYSPETPVDATGPASPGERMEVEFWRGITNSHGWEFRSALLTVQVPDPVDEEQAVAQAKRVFCTWAKTANWSNVAHGYELRRLAAG